MSTLNLFTLYRLLPITLLALSRIALASHIGPFGTLPECSHFCLGNIPKEYEEREDSCLNDPLGGLMPTCMCDENEWLFMKWYQDCIEQTCNGEDEVEAWNIIEAGCSEVRKPLPTRWIWEFVPDSTQEAVSKTSRSDSDAPRRTTFFVTKTVAAETTPPPRSEATDTPSSNDSEIIVGENGGWKPSTGAIAGIAIGGAVLVGLLIWVAVVLIRVRRRGQQQYPPELGEDFRYPCAEVGDERKPEMGCDTQKNELLAEEVAVEAPSQREDRRSGFHELPGPGVHSPRPASRASSLTSRTL